ncbi:diguanylate cyclase [Streptomyces sp. NPDC007084]|uniref:diguanylate cyclase domain-containing protein n=1 Tax=Streptomyces sp. NPDC007084 TaxID=3154313 RepID=UPI00345329B4
MAPVEQSRPEGAHPLAEVGETSLHAILADRWRLEQGEMRFAAYLRARGADAPVTMLLIDLDGSTAVRRLGVGPKRALLAAVRARIARVADPQVILDAGQRDKTYVVIQAEHSARAREVAERVRREIAAAPVSIGPRHAPVSITASVGVAVLPGSCSADAAWERARDAVVIAKQKRDSVHVAEGGASGLSPELRRGLDLLSEKRGPLHYWAVERATDIRAALSGLTVPVPGIPRPAQDVFTLLVSTAVAESVLRSWRTEGFDVTVTGLDQRPDPAAFDFVTPGPANRWLVMRRGNRGAASPYDHDRSVAEIHHAITGDALAAPTMPAPLLGPWAGHALRRTAAPGRRGTESLLSEALALGIQHRKIWTGDHALARHR